MTRPDLPALLDVAREAVSVAARDLRTGTVSQVTAKGDRDIATDLDIAVERRIRGFLRQHTPAIGFLGEEEGDDTGLGLRWILDPVDGTANFCGLPLTGIFLALADGARPLLGSTAADLALVADGTLNASLTLGNRSWDMAVGAAIARAAGAIIMDAAGSPYTLGSLSTIAAAPRLVGPVLGIVRGATAGTRYARGKAGSC